MKILVDQNISFRLLDRILPLFPEVCHVKDFNLINSNDLSIYNFAREHKFEAIITFDRDFYHIQLEHSSFPKIIWLRTGNCRTSFIAEILIQNRQGIQDFLKNDSLDCLEIF